MGGKVVHFLKKSYSISEQKCSLFLFLTTKRTECRGHAETDDIAIGMQSLEHNQFKRTDAKKKTILVKKN